MLRKSVINSPPRKSSSPPKNLIGPKVGAANNKFNKMQNFTSQSILTAQFQNTRDSERSAAVPNSRPFADDNADGSLLQDNEFEQNFVRREIRHAQMDEMLTSFSNTQTQIVITQFNFQTEKSRFPNCVISEDQIGEASQSQVKDLLEKTHLYQALMSGLLGPQINFDEHFNPRSEYKRCWVEKYEVVTNVTESRMLVAEASLKKNLELAEMYESMIRTYKAQTTEYTLDLAKLQAKVREGGDDIPSDSEIKELLDNISHVQHLLAEAHKADGENDTRRFSSNREISDVTEKKHKQDLEIAKGSEQQYMADYEAFKAMQVYGVAIFTKWKIFFSAHPELLRSLSRMVIDDNGSMVDPVSKGLFYEVYSNGCNKFMDQSSEMKKFARVMCEMNKIKQLSLAYHSFPEIYRKAQESISMITNTLGVTEMSISNTTSYIILTILSPAMFKDFLKFTSDRQKIQVIETASQQGSVQGDNPTTAGMDNIRQWIDYTELTKDITDAIVTTKPTTAKPTTESANPAKIQLELATVKKQLAASQKRENEVMAIWKSEGRDQGGQGGRTGGRGQGSDTKGGRGGRICRKYLAGTCVFGNQCFNEHPSGQEGTKAIKEETSSASCADCNVAYAKSHQRASVNKRVLCTNYADTNICLLKDKCPLSHEPEGRAPSGPANSVIKQEPPKTTTKSGGPKGFGLIILEANNLMSLPDDLDFTLHICYTCPDHTSGEALARLQDVNDLPRPINSYTVIVVYESAEIAFDYILFWHEHLKLLLVRLAHKRIPDLNQMSFKQIYRLGLSEQESYRFMQAGATLLVSPWSEVITRQFHLLRSSPEESDSESSHPFNPSSPLTCSSPSDAEEVSDNEENMRDIPASPKRPFSPAVACTMESSKQSRTAVGGIHLANREPSQLPLSLPGRGGGRDLTSARWEMNFGQGPFHPSSLVGGSLSSGGGVTYSGSMSSTTEHESPAPTVVANRSVRHKGPFSADAQRDIIQGPVTLGGIPLPTVHLLQQYEINNSNNLSTSYNTSLGSLALLANTTIHEAQRGVSHVPINYSTITDYEVEEYIQKLEVATTRYTSAITLVEEIEQGMISFQAEVALKLSNIDSQHQLNIINGKAVSVSGYRISRNTISSTVSEITKLINFITTHLMTLREHVLDYAQKIKELKAMSRKFRHMYEARKGVNDRGPDDDDTDDPNAIGNFNGSKFTQLQTVSIPAPTVQSTSDVQQYSTDDDLSVSLKCVAFRSRLRDIKLLLIPLSQKEDVYLDIQHTIVSVSLCLNAVHKYVETEGFDLPHLIDLYNSGSDSEDDKPENASATEQQKIHFFKCIAYFIGNKVTKSTVNSLIRQQVEGFPPGLKVNIVNFLWPVVEGVMLDDLPIPYRIDRRSLEDVTRAKLKIRPTAPVPVITQELGPMQTTPMKATPIKTPSANVTPAKVHVNTTPYGFKENGQPYNTTPGGATIIPLQRSLYGSRASTENYQTTLSAMSAEIQAIQNSNSTVHSSSVSNLISDLHSANVLKSTQIKEVDLVANANTSASKAATAITSSSDECAAVNLTVPHHVTEPDISPTTKCATIGIDKKTGILTMTTLGTAEVTYVDTAALTAEGDRYTGPTSSSGSPKMFTTKHRSFNLVMEASVFAFIEQHPLVLQKLWDTGAGLKGAGDPRMFVEGSMQKLEVPVVAAGLGGRVKIETTGLVFGSNEEVHYMPSLGSFQVSSVGLCCQPNARGHESGYMFLAKYALKWTFTDPGAVEIVANFQEQMSQYLTGIAYQHSNIYIETLAGAERDAMLAHVNAQTEGASSSSSQRAGSSPWG